LRGNQLNLYNQIINLNFEFNKTIEDNIENIDLVVTKITQTAQDLIVKKKDPNIYRYITETFIEGYTNAYTLTLKGNNFNRSNNIYILVNGQKIQPKQITFSELVFKIDPKIIVPKSDEENYVEVDIVFEWQKGLFKKSIKDIEPFIIPTIPYNIGTATVFYEQEIPERNYTGEISYSCDCSTGPSGWQGNRRHQTTAFNLNPSGGRKFDPNTVTVPRNGWTQRYGGSYSFDYKTEQQIKGEISCYSDGRPRGGGGFSRLTFTYKEYDIIYKVHKNQTSDKELNSVNPVIFELPDPADGKRPNVSYISVKTYDNKTITLLPNESNKYFKLTINPVTDDVSVSWKN
jgi:hypothetical protein